MSHKADDVLGWKFVGKTMPGGAPIPMDRKRRHRYGRTQASTRSIDALSHASGETVCRLSCGGSIDYAHDHFLCTEYTVLWRADATDVIRRWAVKRALSVAHMWDIPEAVMSFLLTSDEKLKIAAEQAVALAKYGDTVPEILSRDAAMQAIRFGSGARPQTPWSAACAIAWAATRREFPSAETADGRVAWAAAKIAAISDADAQTILGVVADVHNKELTVALNALGPMWENVHDAA